MVRRRGAVVPIMVGVFVRMMAIVMIRQFARHRRHRAVFMRNGHGMLDGIGRTDACRTDPRHREGDAERLYEQPDVGP
jgi:hypothetical protein